MLQGKVILITGGGSGLGAAAAAGAARDGAKVVVADIAEAAARQVADACQGSAVTVDVRNSASVQAMVAEVVAQHGRIDGLFHSAMSVPLVNKHDRRITELPESVWDDILSLVLTGTFLVSKYVARQMLAQPDGGSMVLTATTDALLGQAGLDGYTAAKGGVVSMTRSMAAGLSPQGVRVNAICPGFVDTPHQREFLEVPALRARIEALQLMPVMSAADASELGLFLLSDRARYQTGGIHVCDSGYSAFKGKLDVLEVFDRPEG